MRLRIKNQRREKMQSQLYWLVPKQVLYWKLSGRITGNEIAEMSRFIAENVEKSTAQKVHILIDTIGVEQLDYNSQEARAAFLILAKKEWMGKVVAIIRD